MPQQTRVDEIVRSVRSMFDAAQPRGIYLRLAGQRFDDDWLYLVAEPTRGGGDATEHARFMTEVERSLHADGFDQVLLVPAVPDYDGLAETNGTTDGARTPQTTS